MTNRHKTLVGTNKDEEEDNQSQQRQQPNAIRNLRMRWTMTCNVTTMSSNSFASYPGATWANNSASRNDYHSK